MNEKLIKYCREDNLPMHMPGHKRNPDVISSEFLCDITEIDGFDNLHNPTGVIKEINDLAAKIWDAKEAYISVNGSSAMLMAAIIACSNNTKEILVASNCHISVWHGIELSGLCPVVIEPEITEYGFYGRLNPDTVREAIRNNPEAKLLIYTTPTYEGIISNTEEISRIADENNVTVILDSAHGAHLNLKSDIVVKSLHKTLNSPTQTSVMLNFSEKANPELLKHYVGMFQSTSPSYVLMGGIASCLKSHGENKIDTWKNIAEESKNTLKTMKHLSVLDTDDFSKIIILTNGYITGAKLSDILRNRYKIELEASYSNYVIAMTGIGDTAESLKRFTDSLLEIDKELEAKAEQTILSTKNTDHKLVMKSGDAIRSNKVSSDLDKSLGLIAGEYVFAYPPGIPILLPGEVITEEKILQLKSAGELKCDPYRPWCDKVLTVDTNQVKQV